ncbi:MAG: hypothetical protein QOK16_1132, partial [Solirubrobacteraceae bacterium]|nr:hypothetical protein [Solirubrobacteraceae bacterium]
MAVDKGGNFRRRTRHLLLFV